jgi:hypothetical protein
MPRRQSGKLYSDLVTLGFWLSSIVLCSVQGLLVLVPGRQVVGRSRVVGVLVPAGLLVLGVLLVRDVSDGARFLTDLATFGTPVAAAVSGYLLGWRRSWLTVIAAAGLYLIAWRGEGLAGDAAGVALIALACLSGAAVAGRLIGQRELVVGLVLLTVLDVILVFGTSQVAQTTDTLHGVVPPAAAGRPLPALQDVTFGSAMMGWLDLLAPALLGVILVGSPRRHAAAAAVTLSALAWGTLLYATPVIPATVPVLLGLVVGLWPGRSDRSADRGQAGYECGASSVPAGSGGAREPLPAGTSARVAGARSAAS